ncbi:helix-turn-helix domain-containing protein [Chromobacterium phragmitis]|uniref:HTH cro/C1-type domain-containing protein n=1 Tax=Chromobacterium phragmitis TaxID=2202141 RepID=A0ABV0J0S0_9NEIS
MTSAQPDNIREKIAQRILQERKRLRLTQQTAADQTGVSREMWGRYERGDALPGGEPLLGFALAGADIQFILAGTQSQKFTPSSVHQAVLDAVYLLSLEDRVDSGQLASAVVKILSSTGAVQSASQP